MLFDLFLNKLDPPLDEFYNRVDICTSDITLNNYTNFSLNNDLYV